MSDSAPREPQKDLDELIAQFEDEVRKRPTPAEIAEAEKVEAARAPAGAKPSAPSKPAPVEATLPLVDVSAVEAPAKPAPIAARTAPVASAARAAPVASAASAAPVPSAAPAAPVSSSAAAGVEDLESWWAGGERVEVELPGGMKRTIFTRVLGNGPWLTMIHGFPTSSWDWAPVAPALAARYRLLTFDLLGFGDSDKPSGHDWSSFEQADIVEALWLHLGVKETRVVAHDVGMTVALELLARQEESQLGVQITDYTLLNGGVYAGFHRPRPIQVWLQRPVVGALIAQLLSESRFGPALAEIFGPDHQPTAEDLHQHWESVKRRDGSKYYHRLIKYIPERRANKERWESAVERSAMPIRFVWGMADPVSGAHMAEVIKERRPGADIVELADVGHYPQLEAPDRVAAAIIEGPLRGAHGPRRKH